MRCIRLPILVTIAIAFITITYASPVKGGSFEPSPQGSVMPDSATGAHNDGRFDPGYWDNVYEKMGREVPQFYGIDENGNPVQQTPGEALAGDNCWGTSQPIMGMSGDTLCCPGGANHASIRKKRLECMTAGGTPEEYSLNGASFANGSPLPHEMTDGCMGIKCDQGCDQSSAMRPADGRMAWWGGGGVGGSPGDTGRDPSWYGKGTGDDEDDDFTIPMPGTQKYDDYLDDLRENQADEQKYNREQNLWRRQREAKARARTGTPKTSKEIVLGKAYTAEEKANREYTDLDNKAKEAEDAVPKPGDGRYTTEEEQQKKLKAAEEARAKADAAKEKAEKAKKAREAAERAVEEEQAKKKKASEDETMPVDPLIGGGDPNEAERQRCKEHPETCDKEAQVINPVPDDIILGGAPIEEEELFWICDDGNMGIGGGRSGSSVSGSDRAAAIASAAAQIEASRNCGGRRPEGAGGGGGGHPEGDDAERAGNDIDRDDEDISSSGEAVRGGSCGGDEGVRPGIPVETGNPGDPTFFDGCGERSCVSSNPNRAAPSTTLNNCPQNTFAGRRSGLSCGVPMEWKF